MKEQIGSVVLDLEQYPGEDFYSEGAGEDLLLKLVSEHEPGDYNRLIAENANWSVLYHLSDLRHNIVDFLPIGKEHKVLEVGSGCGAITGALAQRAGSVTCIELSKKRSMINAYRHRNCDNVEIKVGNFQDIEKVLPADYDYIMLIGVFEYGASYIQGEDPYNTFLRILLGHLKQDGRLVIAIENRYGLKYWAGCREDHLGTFFSGPEGYRPGDGVRTFSRQRLLQFAADAGCSARCYYPFPDYKFPVTVYSDDRLPRLGELSGGAPNFDYDRLLLFDEGRVYDGLIQEGLFGEYSNSFLMVLSRETVREGTQPIYSRHSNERAPEYAIRTDIEMDRAGHKYVCKRALTDAAAAHVRRMKDSEELLCAQYQGSAFCPNRIVEGAEEAFGTPAAFEYVEGQSLEEILTALFAAGETEKALELLDRLSEEIGRLDGQQPFTATDGFREMFLTGEADEKVLEGLPALEHCNLDLIPSNILVGDRWNVIDYEWVTDFPVPLSYVIYRSLYYLTAESLGGDGREMLGRLCGRYGITEQQAGLFERMEGALQRRINGDRLSLIGFHSIMGRDAVPLALVMNRAKRSPRLDRVKVYYDLGEGFSEENTACYIAQMDNEEHVRLAIPVRKGTKALRLDPADDPCLLGEMHFSLYGAGNGPESGEGSIDRCLTNGLILSGGSICFPAPDPQLIFQNLPEGEVFFAEYTIAQLPSAFRDQIGAALTEGADRKAGFFKRRKGPYEQILL